MQTQARADGRAQWHDRSRPGIDETPRKHNIIRRIRQNREAFLHQDLGRVKRTRHIGVQGTSVANDFDLDPV